MLKYINTYTIFSIFIICTMLMLRVIANDNDSSNISRIENMISLEISKINTMDPPRDLLNDIDVECVFRNNSNYIVSLDVRMIGNTLLHSYFDIVIAGETYYLYDKVMFAPVRLALPKNDNFIYLFPRASYGLELRLSNYELAQKNKITGKPFKVNSLPNFQKCKLTFHYNNPKINFSKVNKRKNRIYFIGKLISNPITIVSK